MLRLAAHFPDAPILAAPDPHHRFRQALHQIPRFPGYAAAKQQQGVDGYDDFAKDIELQMFGGGVADADGAGVFVAAEVVEGVFLQRRIGADAVNDAYIPAVDLALFQQPVDVTVGAVNVAQAVEDVHGEGGVAQPRETVVPVAGAADGLRQAGGGRGDDGPGARVHHQVQDEEGAHYLVSPESGIAHSLHQPFPEARCLGQLAGGTAPLQAGKPPIAVDQNEGGALSLGQGEGERLALAVERKGDAGEKGHGLASAVNLNRPAAGVAAQGTETGDGAGVVVPRAEVAAQFDLAGVAGDDAVNLVGRVRRRGIRVAVVIAGQGHEVGDGDLAAGAGEGSLQNVGVGEVLLARLEAGGGRADAEVAANAGV